MKNELQATILIFQIQFYTKANLSIATHSNLHFIAIEDKFVHTKQRVK